MTVVLQTVCKGVRETVIIVYRYCHHNKDMLGIHSGVKLYIQVLFQRTGPCKRPCLSSMMQLLTLEIN